MLKKDNSKLLNIMLAANMFCSKITLKLLLDKEKSDIMHPLTPTPFESDKNYFFNPFLIVYVKDSQRIEPENHISISESAKIWNNQRRFINILHITNQCI